MTKLSYGDSEARYSWIKYDLSPLICKGKDGLFPSEVKFQSQIDQIQEDVEDLENEIEMIENRITEHEDNVDCQVRTILDV